MPLVFHVYACIHTHQTCIHVTPLLKILATGLATGCHPHIVIYIYIIHSPFRVSLIARLQHSLSGVMV